MFNKCTSRFLKFQAWNVDINRLERLSICWCRSLVIPTILSVAMQLLLVLLLQYICLTGNKSKHKYALNYGSLNCTVVVLNAYFAIYILHYIRHHIKCLPHIAHIFFFQFRLKSSFEHSQPIICFLSVSILWSSWPYSKRKSWQNELAGGI